MSFNLCFPVRPGLSWRRCISHAIIEFDLNGQILDANENFGRMVGYTQNELVGRHHRMLVEPVVVKSEAYRLFWERLAKVQFDKGQYKQIGKGGKEIWIEASYNPVFRRDGHLRSSSLQLISRARRCEQPKT